MRVIGLVAGMAATLLFPWTAVTDTGAESGAAAQVTMARSDLEIVECLLPGQVRQLGKRTFLSPRRPVRTTTSDCRIRGGEYVAYDRADYKSALRIWMAAAEEGDPDAQTNVGEIYERGLGDSPNYEAALIWYRRAADQGYSRALFNLGTLYEQGLGVPVDRLEALNLYRRAWGIPVDSLIFESAAQREQSALRAQLDQVIADKDRQISVLNRQLTTLEGDLVAAQRDSSERASAAASLEAEVQTLRGLISGLEDDRSQSQARLSSLPTTRAPGLTPTPPAMDSAAVVREFRGLPVGRYFALVIGNQDYQQIEDLATPRADAAAAARLLRDKYGFTVQTIEDADDVAMLQALNQLNEVLRGDDNLLIYYAGHGTRLPGRSRGEAGYWLPVNAEPPPRDTYWLPNEQVTAHLARLPARRVLVVADSCYAGLLSTDPAVNMFGTEGQVTPEYVKYKLPKRSRLLLASGGDQPVLDQAGGGNSVFARAFLDVLDANDGVLSGPALYARIRERMRTAAARDSFTQEPVFKTIKGAGHEVGDFFLLPAIR